VKYGIELLSIHSVTMVINCHISRVHILKKSFRDEKHAGLRDGYLIIAYRYQRNDAVLLCDVTANEASPLREPLTESDNMTRLSVTSVNNKGRTRPFNATVEGN
jgi:hypothetical protein